MKVEFDAIKDLTPHIWTEGREWMWMAKVWEILEKKGRTTYETQTEKLQVYMLAVSAATVYLDYNHIVFNEVSYSMRSSKRSSPRTSSASCTDALGPMIFQIQQGGRSMFWKTTVGQS